MPTNFPASLDALSNPTAANNLDTAGVVHADQHANANDALEALEAKLGIGASTATASTVLRGTGVGATSFGTISAAYIDNRARNRFLPITGATAQTGSPAYGVQGTNLRYAAWAFDAAAVERLCFAFLMPEDVASGNLTIKLYWTNLGAGAGDVVWRVFGRVYAAGEDLNSAASAVDTSNTVTAPTQNVLKVTSHTVAIGVSTALYSLVIGREGTDAADGLANDAGLVAVEIEYTADM